MIDSDRGLDELAPDERRTLILAPTARDTRLCQSILADADIPGVPCADLGAVCSEMERALAGTAVLAEEILEDPNFDRFRNILGAQPAWSDLPVLVLTAQGADSPAAVRLMETLGNATLLERPVRITALVSAVRSALRARDRQYQIREYITETEGFAASLREADRRKDEFMAMLAHELRNPLAPIRNGVTVLQDPTLPAGQSREVLAMMDRQVTHLVRLVDDLLDVSRILRGKIDLRPESVELATVLDRAVETSQPLITARQHKLEVRLPPESLLCHADPIRLAQVVANLLNNAAKYNEVPGHIWIDCARDGDEAVIRVRDDGIGIAPEVLPHVFDAFRQADKSLDRAFGGLGLGLTLVRRLTEMHGGTVSASSAGIGRGSEFVVRLPLLPAAEPAAHEQIVAAPARSHTARRILIVDDNADSARTLGLLLGRAGHEVRTAHTGPAGVALAGTFRPEVVLLDIGLPGGMSGYDVAPVLRSRYDLEPLLIVAMTGYGQAEDKARALAAGFDVHLTKPLDLEDVERLLAGLGEEARAETR